MGFRNLGIYERVGYKLGTWHDVGWWQLVLRAHYENPDEPLALSTVMAKPDWKRAVKSGEALIWRRWCGEPLAPVYDVGGIHLRRATREVPCLTAGLG